MKKNEKNVVEEVVQDQENKKMKVQRQNSFVKMKKKPLILTVALAGAIAIGSIGTLTFINTDKFEVNLEDYDKAVTLSVDVKKRGADEVNIDFCTLSEYNDTAYNITTTDEWDIYVGPNNATLIDVNPEGKDPKMSKLDSYDKAVVNIVGELEEFDINAASIGLLGDHPVYIQSYEGKRQLVSANNTAIYREINDKDLKNFKNTENFDKAFIDLNNDLIKFDSYIGERDLVVNDITLKSLAIKWKDGKYYEYITLPEQCAYEGKVSEQDNYDFEGRETKFNQAIIFYGSDNIGKNVFGEAKVIHDWSSETPFVYIVTPDGRKIKISVTNTILVSKEMDTAYNAERAGELIYGVDKNRQIIDISGFGLASMEFKNKVYATVDRNSEYHYAIGTDYAIPVSTVDPSKLSDYTMFDQRTTCTIKTLGLEEMFVAEGYRVIAPPYNDGVEYVEVLRKVDNTYFEYYIPKGSFMFNSRELDIGRTYQKTK